METRRLPGGITSSYPVGLATLGIGVIINIAGVVTPEWLSASNPKPPFIKLSLGLWRLCAEEECRDIPDAFKEDYLKACEAFAILGILASGAAFALGAIFVVLPMMGKSPKKALTDAAFAIGLVGVVFIVICVGVWGGKAKQEFLVLGVDLDPNFGYSFYLSVASLFLIAVGSVVVFAQGRRSGLSYVPIG